MKYALLAPLSLQNFAILTHVLERVAFSQQFFVLKSKVVKLLFFIRGQDRNFLKVKMSKIHLSLVFSGVIE